MKEKENTSTSSKKRLIYSIIVAVCALLLVTATILTVYFVTNSGGEVLDNPPVENPPIENPPIENPPVENPPVEPGGGEGIGKPSSGEKVEFIKPLESSICSVEYNVVYNNTSTDKWYKHMAIDFVADAGTAVCAMADGKVVKISMEEVLGNYIVVEHDDGIRTVYRFVEPVSNLREGDSVKQGQTIATVAQAYGTEYKDGTHLHLEMTQDGKYVDPSDYIDSTLEEK